MLNKNLYASWEEIIQQIKQLVRNTMLDSFMDSDLPRNHFIFYTLHLQQKGQLLLTHFKEIT